MEESMGNLFLVVTQFVLVAAIVKLAVENVQNALENEGRYDEIMVAGSVAVCLLFDWGLIELILGTESTFRVGAYVDYIISGAAFSGGGARLLKRLKKAKEELDEVKG